MISKSAAWMALLLAVAQCSAAAAGQAGTVQAPAVQTPAAQAPASQPPADQIRPVHPQQQTDFAARASQAGTSQLGSGQAPASHPQQQAPGASQGRPAFSPVPTPFPRRRLATPQTPAPSNSPALQPGAPSPQTDYQPPHITIATEAPAPAPAPWPLPERILWVAELLLVLLGYVGIMLALSTLKKIERSMQYGENAATAAAESAQAALLHAQALVRAERPWILMSARPSNSLDNGFTVVATNRGRGPARIVTTVDAVVNAVDETGLALTPEYKNKPAPPAEPTILLPGESTEIAAFSRGDVKKVCETDEKLKRVENWEEKIFLYGNVEYEDLGAQENAQAHQSSWCCWYIHGRQKSGMVMAGSPAYNRHT